MKKLPFLFFLFLMIVSQTSVVFAANNIVTVGYDPLAPQFSKGVENVIYITLSSQNGGIAAAKMLLSASGGLSIVSVLSPLDAGMQPIANAKIIDQKISPKTASETILLLSATADLPSLIKIPVVVKGTNAGNLGIDIKESQIIDGNGVTYDIKQPKMAYITFSNQGKDQSIPPTPTSLPATSVVTNLTLKFQGVKPSDIKVKTMPNVKVQLVEGTGLAARLSLPQFISVTADTQGLWHGSAIFPNIKPGKDYAILVKGPKHVQKRICANDPTEEKLGSYTCSDNTLEIVSGTNNINLSGISLMAGDVGIQDGVVNTYDLSFIQNTIRKTAQNPASDADVTYDGKVTKADYDVVVYTLRNTGGLDQK